MKNQIIKKNVEFFEDFIKENFTLENSCYIFNHIVFKRLLFQDKVYKFLERLQEYYYKNKHYYITRNPITFNQFNTVLRQICKKNDLEYISKIKYNSSKYNIEYYISV